MQLNNVSLEIKYCIYFQSCQWILNQNYFFLPSYFLGFVHFCGYFIFYLHELVRNVGWSLSVEFY